MATPVGRRKTQTWVFYEPLDLVGAHLAPLRAFLVGAYVVLAHLKQIANDRRTNQAAQLTGCLANRYGCNCAALRTFHRASGQLI